jgi:hypothetical protein
VLLERERGRADAARYRGAGITITLFMFNSDQNNAHPFASVLYGTVIE